MSAAVPLNADLLEPPDDATVARALEEYARAIRREYGSRVRGIYLFGSRARGDHTRESDADVAVVLADGDWDYWAEKMRLTDLTYDFLVATGADLQGWPLRETQWAAPETHHNPDLVKAMRRDARAIRPAK